MGSIPVAHTIQCFRHTKYPMCVFNMVCAGACECDCTPVPSRPELPTELRDIDSLVVFEEELRKWPQQDCPGRLSKDKFANTTIYLYIQCTNIFCMELYFNSICCIGVWPTPWFLEDWRTLKCYILLNFFEILGELSFRGACFS